MEMTTGESISVIMVFLQGMISFFSPCVLPLLPLYIGYLAGGTKVYDEEGKPQYDRKRVLLNTLFFVTGIGFSFFVLGLGLRAIGRFFSGNQFLFARIGGLIVILFGLYQLGLFGSIDKLDKERRLPVNPDKMAMSPFTAFLMGFVFSFAWTPCVGPTLSSVLIFASSAKDPEMGFLLIGVYTLGFAMPFLLAGLFTTSLLALLKKHRGIVRYTSRIGGVIMLFMGIMMLTGHMNDITSYMSRISEPDSSYEQDTVIGDISKDAQASDTADIDAAASDTGSASSYSSQAAPAEGSKEDTEGPQQDVSEEATDKEVIPAPDFTLTDQFGNTHTLSEYKGKIVFLNFWATWCPPCRAEMPYIQELYKETVNDPESDVVILGVAFPGNGKETDTEGIIDFINKNGYSYPTVMDTKGELIYPYYIMSFPTTYMIDTDGNIYGYVPGSMTRDTMDSIIEQTRNK
ncbi:MAG: redoxin domain-containing protein [Lachnospiraceae bacterium]|nr:redoxin domain-containing protein [Lachnospiraceae bacterium]